MLIQVNTAPIEEQFWVEPDDFHCMFGPFSSEAEAERMVKTIQTTGLVSAGDRTPTVYLGALRVVRARTRIYPQDWQGEHSPTYLTKLDFMDEFGSEVG